MRTRTVGAAALAAIATLSACRAIVATAALGTAAVVGSVYYVGYGVYKGGAAVVSAVGSAGSSATGAVGDTYSSVVISRGTFKTDCAYSVEVLHPAAEEVFEELGFRSMGGQKDALAGSLLGKTALGEVVSVKLDLIEKGRTKVEILIGEGNLKQSQYIFDQMIAKVAADSEGGEQ